MVLIMERNGSFHSSINLPLWSLYIIKIQVWCRLAAFHKTRKGKDLQGSITIDIHQVIESEQGLSFSVTVNTIFAFSCLQSS